MSRPGVGREPTLMSQKWPFRGSERTFPPLRGLREERISIAKGAAHENKRRLFEFSPYHTKVLHLMGSRVLFTFPPATRPLFRVIAAVSRPRGGGVRPGVGTVLAAVSRPRVGREAPG